ncbi:hypothetical protein EOD39_18490 [Acipenser ruthenus]|uniref:Uncharacterized protein n=1 Tax=Acipenser ruthenus TaxID=7906 RepID=A0A444V0V7_ACIRT|nr:hypothetical protein EOD39_18490 [Acipenser ruthenus]
MAMEPMEETPCERPEGGVEPRGSDGTLGAEALLDAQEDLGASPEPTTREPAAEGPPPEKQPPRAPLPSDRNDMGLEPGVGAEEGAEETLQARAPPMTRSPCNRPPPRGRREGRNRRAHKMVVLSGEIPSHEQMDQEPGPQPTTEGLVLVVVTEGAQEGPPED